MKKLQKYLFLNFGYILSVLFFGTCCFLHKDMKPFQPIYFFYLPILLSITSILIYKQKFKISQSIYYSFLCLFYWLFGGIINNSFSLSNINIVIAISYYFIGITLLKTLKKYQALIISKILLVSSLIYISVETVLRLKFNFSLINILLAYVSIQIRGPLKESSFMCIDSNSVSLLLLTLFFFAYYLYKNVEKNKFFIACIIWNFILIITTISRATLIFLFLSIIIFELFYFLRKHIIRLLYFKKKLTCKLFLFLLFIPLPIIFTLLKTISLFLDDYSFNTKIELILEFFKYIKQVSFIDLLLGIGTDINIIEQYFSRATHSFINTYVVCYGIIGFILILLFWYKIIKETNYKACIIILPTILVGFALTFPSSQIFYATLALIYYFEHILPIQKRRKNAISINHCSGL